MVNLILKFGACLRKMDFKISTSEVLDCVRHMELIDVIDEFQFSTALRTNFVKSHRDRPLFDHLYHLYFHELKSPSGEDKFYLEEEDQRTLLPEDIMEKLTDQLEQTAKNKDVLNALLDFIAGDPADYLGIIRQLQRKTHAPKTTRSNLAPLSDRLSIMLQINKIKQAFPRFLEEAGFDDDTQSTVQQNINERLDHAYNFLAEDTGPENSSLKIKKELTASPEDPKDIPFSNLTQKQIEDMRITIQDLVRKLNDMVQRRSKKRNKGVLDIKKTLRNSAKYQGVPIDIRFKEKPPGKGKIVTLCDVSGSVWSTAKFMLNMLYSLQDCFSRVKSFVFISDIIDVTDYFEKHEPEEAIDRVMDQDDITYGTITDYGNTFRQFKENHISSLDKKTTIIIIGDGRSNYLNPYEHILDDMREKSKRIIWLTPEPERLWGTGDSEILTYKAYCHELRVCRNLNQLTEFIEELVL